MTKNPIIILNPGYSAFERKLIGVAFEYVERCSKGQSRHISFIVQRRKIITVGWNNEFKSHTLGRKFGQRAESIHSELHAISRFPHRDLDIVKTIMYNVRITRDNRIVQSKPCEACLKMVMAYNLNGLCFTNSEGVFEWV